jgi:uncharacterized phage-like protein YoqJ
MIISGTGHRLDKLGGFYIPNSIFNYVCKSTEKILIKENPSKIISGMAIGYDTWLAQIAYKLGIPFIAAVPFVGQESRWPESSKELYRKLLSLACDVVIVSDGSYSPEKMQIRNEYMVNHSDKVLACWNGSVGGTGNCVRYATSIGKEIIRINPADANNYTSCKKSTSE